MKDKLSNFLSLQILSILALGIAISLGIYSWAVGIERIDIKLHFAKMVDKTQAALQWEIDVAVENILSIKSLYKASSNVTREEFKIFTSQMLKTHPSLQAVEWIPRITHQNRSLFEKEIINQGYPDFLIREHNQQGGLIPATKRKYYYPVTYAEPFLKNKNALGYDSASSPTRLLTLKKAMTSGEPQITPRIRLVQATTNQFGILIIVPIYRNPSSSLPEKNKKLLGFALGVYRIGSLFENALKKINHKWIHARFLLYDQNTQKDSLLYEHALSEPIEKSDHYKYQTKVSILGRDWLLIGQPSLSFISELSSYTPSIILIAGLAFTLLMMMYIAERNRELNANKKYTETIIKTVKNGIITISQKGLIEFVNPAVSHLFGFSPIELLNKNIKVLMPEPYSSAHDGYILNFLESKQPKIIGKGREVTGLRKDGSTFPMDLAISEMIINGQIKFLGIVTDITERHKSRSLLIDAKERAEESNRLKSEFLNVVSHELRTPLTVVLGNVPLLLDIEDMPGENEVVEIAKDIQNSCLHLLTLINDFLDISKIEAGKLVLEKTKFSSRTFIERLNMPSLETLVRKKSLTLKLQIDKVMINADVFRLKQVLLNIIMNSIKFTDSGCITLVISQNNDDTLFIVEDTGCGISEKALPFIFDTFRQVDGSSTKVSQGTGLGLAITKRLVELHHGEIDFASEYDKGTRVSIRIPREAA